MGSVDRPGGLRAWFWLAVGATLLLSASVLGQGAEAQGSRKTDTRKQAIPSTKNMREKSDTASPARQAEPSPPVSLPNTSDDEATPPPFNLPSASRARVRECSDKWQTMKLEGHVGNGIWRDFAARCFAAEDGSSRQR